MARSILVTPEQLETAASKIDSLTVDYKSEYNRLFKETSAMASSWSGKDNLAFISQIEGFRDDFDKMHQRMVDYSEFLKKSAKAYRDTQETITADAKKLVN